MRIFTKAPQRYVVTDIAYGEMKPVFKREINAEVPCADVVGRNGRTISVLFTVEELETLLRMAKGEPK